MEKRLELERRGRAPDQIKELNLDNARSVNIVGLTDEYVNLEVLSLINVGLTNLKGFPNLPKLKKLELSENRLTNGFLTELKGCPNLQTLTLCGNKIADFEDLEPLKDFKHLESLDLFSCDITQTENYRNKVFNLIPSLKYLDGFDSDDKEAKDASEMDEASDSDDGDFNEDSDLDEEDQIVDDEELDEEEDEASDSDEGDEEVGLSALIGDINEESDNEENFEPEATNGDHASDEDDFNDEDIYEDGDEKDLSDVQENRGLKRKHEAEQDNE